MLRLRHAEKTKNEEKNRMAANTLLERWRPSGYRESILKTGLLLFSLVGEVEDVLLVGLHAVVLLT